MKKPTLVSVVIPCYNLGEYLDEALDSVKNQSYKNVEIILVDDGSTDVKTKEKVLQIQKDNPNITVIIQENVGLSETRNNGIKVAKGEYIVCLDADDKLYPDYIKKTLSVFKSDNAKKLGFVTTWLQEFENRDGIWQTSGYNPGRLLVENIVHAGSMFKRKAWEKVGGYKKIMKGGYEDWEFWISMLEAGYKWDVLPEPLFNYRVRSNSMLSTASKIHLELYERIINAHKDIYSQFSFELAKFSANRIQSLHEEIIDKNITINDYHKLQFEYEQLKKSKIVSPAMKLRDFHIKIKKITNRSS